MPILGTVGAGSIKSFGGLANLGYFIKNSVRLRFNSTSSSTSYFSRTNSSSPTNNKIGTLSFWVKRGIIGSQTGNGQYLIETGTGTSDSTHFSFVMATNDTFSISQYTVEPLLTTRVFRDPAAWYHIVFVFDSTQGTAANRYKLYVNGVLETALTRPGDCPLNSNWAILNSGQAINIGRHTQVGRGTEAYLAEWNLIDGQVLDPSYFGKTDAATGQWIPKKYAGTYGTNGFYLKFSDIATTSGSNAGLGKDFSGNGNYWNTNNISVTSGATYDAMVDSPTTSAVASNFAVLNPLDIGSNAPTLTNGHLAASTSSTGGGLVRATMAVSSGKWYWETTLNSQATYVQIGISSIDYTASAYTYLESIPGALYFISGFKGTGPTGTNTSYGSSVANGDVVGVALDMDAGTLIFYKNGVSMGTAFTSITGTYLPSFADSTNTIATSFDVNFGQRPFAYTLPTGYKALNTFNLP